MPRLSMEDFIIAMPEKKIETKQKQTKKQKILERIRTYNRYLLLFEGSGVGVT